MSHVDEGTLHAYLDGALDAYPPSEAARIREHLDACEECATRLEEVRAVRDRASSVLDLVDPGSRGMPPLDELRRRADTGAPARAGRLGRMRRVAWAASVVVALGTGWMLRGEAPRLADAALRQAGPDRPSPAASPVPPVEAPIEAPSADQPDVQAEPAPTVPTEQEAASSPPPAAADETVEAALSGAGSAARRTLAEPEPLAVPDPLTVTPRSVVFRDEAAASGVAPPAPVALSPSSTSRDAVRADTAGDAPETARRRQAVRDGPAAPRVTSLAEELGREMSAARLRVEDRAREDPRPADGDAPGSLVVPGLEVISVSWLDLGGETEAAVRVLQILAPGDTLEVLHLPAGVEPDRLPGWVDDDRTLLVAPRPEGWLLLRARATREELETLLERLVAG